LLDRVASHGLCSEAASTEKGIVQSFGLTPYRPISAVDWQ